MILLKLHYCNSLKQITSDVNQAVSSIPTTSLDDTMKLVYAAAVVVTREMGCSVVCLGHFASSQQDSLWRRHINNKIVRLRADLSQLEHFQSGRLKDVSDLLCRYGTSGKSISVVIEDLKQKVTALSGKLSRYNKGCR